MAKNIKILLIEDDELIRLTCKNILNKASFDIIQADNGKTGLDLYRQERPDVVITDILMPDKEGLETILDIRKVNPNAKIIAMSGGGSTQNMSFLKIAEKVGATCILPKPFKPDSLLSVIDKVLQPC